MSTSASSLLLRLAACLALFSATAVASGCSSTSSSADDNDGEVLALPTGFPTPRVPEDDPITEEKAELGRYLFYDQRLSGNGTQACGSCHQQSLAFTDGLSVAVGSHGDLHPRNSQSLTNVAYNASLTWANPILTELEQQVLVPLFGESPIELGASGFETEILARFQDDATYGALFAGAFPGDAHPISWDHIVAALSTFVRTMISGDSPFDRFVYHGDVNALSAEARRGMELFYSERLECHHCHGGFNFTESSVHAGSAFEARQFHNTGLYNIDGQGAYPSDNTGVFAITGAPDDMGRFRAPTLRNVGVTAPYMHDGTMATLDEVVRFYEAGGRVLASGPNAGDGRVSPLKSGLVAGFTLSDDERSDLITFLQSLTDETFLTDPRLSDPFASGSL